MSGRGFLGTGFTGFFWINRIGVGDDGGCDVMGDALYADLQFCLNYLGLQYSDWELWQAYTADRAALVKEIKNLPALSNRLMAFILAVDVQYTLCSQQNPNVACLMPSELTKKDSK